MLLHLNFPGVFRRIYAEETEGRNGTFSVNRKYGEPEFKNSEAFVQFADEQKGPAGFLLKQLFDVRTLGLGINTEIEEAVLRSRACFNRDNLRNLELYLKLIVRFAIPEPQDTFVLYQHAEESVRKGASVASVLKLPDFQSEHAHDQFWRLLVNRSHDLTDVVVEDAINTLVEYLPRYSAFDYDDRGLRQRSIYSLLRLLDSAGWGRTLGNRNLNSPEFIIEIAWRIFGEKSYLGCSLLERFASPERGILGWNDLMLFRLQCSADRQGPLYNLQSALIVHQDKTAQKTGLVSQLALLGMRRLSQTVFALFKRTYIDTRRNFLAEANDIPIAAFFGEVTPMPTGQVSFELQSERGKTSLAHRIESARSTAKAFVIYQLSNSLPPNGSGVGCGHYDECGAEDGGGISMLMNKYAFGICFNPDIDENNVLLFLDHCLSHLSSAFFSGNDQQGYHATKTGLPGGLDPNEMGRYWSQRQKFIRERVLQIQDRQVATGNYLASYREDLVGVLVVLDELAAVATAVEVESNGLKPIESQAEARGT